MGQRANVTQALREAENASSERGARQVITCARVKSQYEGLGALARMCAGRPNDGYYPGQAQGWGTICAVLDEHVPDWRQRLDTEQNELWR